MSSTKRASDNADGPAGPTEAALSLGLHINPSTGLCSDYLNHFNEAIMVLEMSAAIPEGLEDFLAWRPRSYTEHFSATRFRNRDAVIDAYKSADPAVREALDELANTMNVMLTATRDAMKSGNSTASADALAKCALTWLKPLVARAGFVINGSQRLSSGKSEASAAQAAVDALLQR